MIVSPTRTSIPGTSPDRPVPLALKVPLDQLEPRALPDHKAHRAQQEHKVPRVPREQPVQLVLLDRKDLWAPLEQSAQPDHKAHRALPDPPAQLGQLVPLDQRVQQERKGLPD